LESAQADKLLNYWKTPKNLKIAEINKDLAFLPENRLDEVKNFVTFILSQDKDKKRKIIQMRGIWKGKGFEGLDIDK
jgi:hypothetical protein